MKGMADREAWLALADEMDPLDLPLPATRHWDPADWDPAVVAAAQRFADTHDLPFPMHDGIDIALELVRHTEEQA